MKRHTIFIGLSNQSYKDQLFQTWSVVSKMPDTQNASFWYHL